MRRSLIFLVLLAVSGILQAQTVQHLPEQKCMRAVTDQQLRFGGYRQSVLMNDYDVHFYFLDIALERTSTYISGNATVGAEVTAFTLDTFALELIDELTVDSVFVNGIQRPFLHTGDHIYTTPTSPLSAGALVSVQVFYHGDPSTGGGFFSGISNDFSPSWGNQVTWTLSEPFNANQWWPCKQALTDKADSSWVFITTSNQNMAGSNGLLKAVVPVAGSKLRYEWKSTYPIDYYLISASVAEYVDYTIYAHPAGTTDSLMIQNFVYDNPATLTYWKNDIDATASFIELFSDLFGLYPFMNEKYGHCMAPLGGGMEHQTMTTLGNFGFYLVCHELGHMWFGDNVTCATWSDIWINEGFASYGEYLTAQYLDSYTEAQSHMADVHDYVMSEAGGSVYIPPAETGDENRIFDGRLSYDKGSAIIHMIRFEMQDDSLFFETLKIFQSLYGDSVATGMDFKDVAENVSGLDFTAFFDQWYFGEGYPTYDISWFNMGDSLYFTSTQSTSTLVTPLFEMLMEYRVWWAGGDTLIRCYQTANVNNFSFYMPHAVQGIEVDPENWVVDGPAQVSLSSGDLLEPACFTLAPNPCHDRLQLFFPNASPSGTITITDAAGRIVRQILHNGNQCEMDLRDLRPGLYLISMNSPEGRHVARFIKE